MDKVHSIVNSAQIKSVLVGAPVNLGSYDDRTLNDITLVMLHCILNGPVGVNKPTTFPVVGAGSIKALCGNHVSNKSWAATCSQLAGWLKTQGHLAEVIAESQQMKIHGDIWPLNNRGRIAA